MPPKKKVSILGSYYTHIYICYEYLTYTGSKWQ